MTSPVFVPVDLTELQDAGVLMAANEAFFWPLGLALTWTHHDDGSASDLHIREWRFDDGHHESIALDSEDEIGGVRREAFAKWVADRDTQP